jgi:hypothetical protein
MSVRLSIGTLIVSVKAIMITAATAAMFQSNVAAPAGWKHSSDEDQDRGEW